MKISVRREPSFVIVDLAGDIDINAVTRIRDTLGDLTKVASPQIVVNLSGATYLDSSALGILMNARRETLKAGGRFVLCGITEPVRMILELTRLNKFFEIYDDEGAARARFT